MKKGQSVLEYVIVLTAIIAAAILVTAAITKNKDSSAVGQLMNASADRITTFSAKIANITGQE